MCFKLVKTKLKTSGPAVCWGWPTTLLAMLIYRDRGVKVKIRINVPVRVNPVQIMAR